MQKIQAFYVIHIEFFYAKWYNEKNTLKELQNEKII